MKSFVVVSRCYFVAVLVVEVSVVAYTADNTSHLDFATMFVVVGQQGTVAPY